MQQIKDIDGTGHDSSFQVGAASAACLARRRGKIATDSTSANNVSRVPFILRASKSTSIRNLGMQYCLYLGSVKRSHAGTCSTGIPPCWTAPSASMVQSAWPGRWHHWGAQEVIYFWKAQGMPGSDGERQLMLRYGSHDFPSPTHAAGSGEWVAARRPSTLRWEATWIGGPDLSTRRYAA